MSTTPPGEGQPDRNPEDPYAYPPPPGSTPPPGGYQEPGGYPSAGHSRPGQPYGSPAGLPQQGGYPEQGGGPAYGHPSNSGFGSGYGAGGGAVPPADDPLVPADLGGWFRRVVGVVNRGFTQLALLQVIVAVANAIVGISLLGGLEENLATLEQFNQRAAGGTPPTPEEAAALAPVFGELITTGITAGLIGLVVFLFVQAASVYVAVHQAAGRPVTAADGLRATPARAIALVGWGVMAWILVAIGSVLILPGIYLALVFGTALVGVVVIERQGIGRCFQLAHSRFLPAIGRLLLTFALALLYGAVAQSIATLIGGQISPTTSIVQALLMIPLGVFFTGSIVVTYAELRFHERGTTTQDLAAELDRP